MRRILALLPFITLILAGCSLAGDVSPPPGLPTALPAQPRLPQATAATPQQAVAETAPSGRPDPAAGASIYLEKCSPCHGERGAGDGPQAANLPVTPALLGDVQLARQAVPAVWYEMVTVGNLERFMPPFASLSDEERWNVVSYALTLSTSAEEVARGEALYVQECAACHGDRGTGVSNAPDLTDGTAMSQRSLAFTFAAVRDGFGESMPRFEATLSEEELWALAAYVRSLAFSAGAPQDEIVLGSIRGQVTNGTAGGKVPEGLELTLHGFDDQVEAVTTSVVVKPTGAFAFTDVDIAPGRIFVVTTEYQGAIYGSQAAHVSGEDLSLDVPLTIYDSTSDASQLRVDRLHLLFDFPGPDLIRVVELWILSNLGDRTVTPQEADGVVKIVLPEGASNLRFEEGELGGRFQAIDGGFADHARVRPGEGTSQIVFSFDLPYKNRLALSHPATLPIEAVVVLMPDGGPSVKGEGLQDLGVRESSSGDYRTYTLGPISAGSRLALDLSGRMASAASAGTSTSSVGTIVGAAALGLTLIGAGFWWRRASSRARTETSQPDMVSARSESQPPPPPSAARVAAYPPELEALLQAIADLDAQHESGALSDDEHQRRRSELKRQALERM